MDDYPVFRATLLKTAIPNKSSSQQIWPDVALSSVMIYLHFSTPS